LAASPLFRREYYCDFCSSPVKQVLRNTYRVNRKNSMGERPQVGREMGRGLDWHMLSSSDYLGSFPAGVLLGGGSLNFLKETVLTILVFKISG
jgi:hypothetical protein